MSPHELRYAEIVTGLLLPFGCEPSHARKSVHKFALKARKRVFLGWQMLLGGKWSGGYLATDVNHFEDAKANVRVCQIQEVIQPTDIVFPLADRAKHVELISPGEEFVVGEPHVDEEAKVPAPPSRAYMGSTRPAYIGSKAWQAMQYSKRLKIEAKETAKRAEELTRSEPPAPAAEDDELLGGGTVAQRGPYR